MQEGMIILAQASMPHLMLNFAQPGVSAPLTLCQLRNALQAAVCITPQKRLTVSNARCCMIFTCTRNKFCGDTSQKTSIWWIQLPKANQQK
jgi:hypothetical protein